MENNKIQKIDKKQDLRFKELKDTAIGFQNQVDQMNEMVLEIHAHLIKKEPEEGKGITVNSLTWAFTELREQYVDFWRNMSRIQRCTILCLIILIIQSSIL